MSGQNTIPLLPMSIPEPARCSHCAAPLALGEYHPNGCPASPQPTPSDPITYTPGAQDLYCVLVTIWALAMTLGVWVLW